MSYVQYQTQGINLLSILAILPQKDLFLKNFLDSLGILQQAALQRFEFS